MNWEALLSRLKHERSDQLLAGYAYRGLNRVIEFEVFRALCLLPEACREPIVTDAQIACRFVEPDRLFRETNDVHSGLERAEVEAALARGEQCFGAFVGGVLASHTWLAPPGAHLRKNVFVHFDPAFAYSRWSFTRPEYRGLHAHGISKRCALDACVANGSRGILSVVDVSNFPSLKSGARTGCIPVGTLLITRAAGPRMVWVSPSCSAYGIELEMTRESCCVRAHGT